MITSPKRVEKTWGYELWIHNDSQYCGKLLVFPEAGNKFSMHYHMIKNETWYVQSGKFEFHYIENGKKEVTFLSVGDVVYIERGLPHQLKALRDDSVIMEVSTQHFDCDSYRIYRDTPKDLE